MALGSKYYCKPNLCIVDNGGNVIRRYLLNSEKEESIKVFEFIIFFFFVLTDETEIYFIKINRCFYHIHKFTFIFNVKSNLGGF